NRADPDAMQPAIDAVRAAHAPTTPVWAIPEDRTLVAPSIRGILAAVDGTLVKGDADLLTREALSVVVAGMSMVNVLPRLTEDAVVVIPADRTEVLLAALLADAAGTFPSIAGIILNGPFPLPEPIERLLDGLASRVPIIATDHGTYDTAVRVMGARGRLAADSRNRYERALSLFQTHVEINDLTTQVGLAESTVVTPLMFAYGLIERARADRKHIVLPEGGDDRILRAAGTLIARDAADLTILGDESEIHARAIELGVDITAARILSPT